MCAGTAAMVWLLGNNFEEFRKARPKTRGHLYAKRRFENRTPTIVSGVKAKYARLGCQNNIHDLIENQESSVTEQK